MVMVWLEGGQGEVRGACVPPPPNTPNCPTWIPPLTQPAARRQACPPGPRTRPGVHSMHGRSICRVVGTAIERPPGGL